MRKLLKIVSTLFFVSLAVGENVDRFDSAISLDTGYIPTANSNRAITHFGLEFENIGAAIHNVVSDQSVFGDSVFGRGAWALGMYFLWQYPQRSWELALHEFGHGSRMGAAGAYPSYFFSEGKGGKHNNVFTYFAYRLFIGRKETGGYTSGRYSLLKGVPSDWSTTISAGGINNSMFFSERIAEESRYGRGHLNHFVAYLRGKMDGIEYVNLTQDGVTFPTGGPGDVASMISDYDQRDYGIELDDIKKGHQISIFASAHTYTYLWSLWQYVTRSKSSFKSLSIHGVQLPDLFHYAGRKGLSYKVNSAYEYDSNTLIPFSIEYLYKGDKSYELSAGYFRNLAPRNRRGQIVRKKGFQNFGAKIFLSSLGGFGISAEGKYAFDGQHSVSVGVDQHHVNSLFGERNITDLREKVGFETWARYSFLYY